MSNGYKIRQQERQSVFGMKICAFLKYIKKINKRFFITYAKE